MASKVNPNPNPNWNDEVMASKVNPNPNPNWNDEVMASKSGETWSLYKRVDWSLMSVEDGVEVRVTVRDRVAS